MPPQGASNHEGATTSCQAEPPTLASPKLDEVQEEFSKQLEETRKDFEEKLQNNGEAEGSFGLNAKDLSLVPNLEIPPKFKMPEFEKFGGNTCPTAHITMFCRKMTGFIENEGLLIHCFQDSLTGPASRWYNQSTRDQIKTWKDFARTFTDQYKHVSDMVPNRLMLQGLEQKPNESLRQYAQRWRDVAAQVQPPIQENEITPMFIDTLKGVLYDRLIGYPAVSFADIVMTGELFKNVWHSPQILITPDISFQKCLAFFSKLIHVQIDFFETSRGLTKMMPKIETSTHRDKKMVEDSTDSGRKQETNLNGASLFDTLLGQMINEWLQSHNEAYSPQRKEGNEKETDDVDRGPLA
ncbi:hypothetical protein GQ457_09G019040 [Hibiscus cannabinus]